MTELVRVLCVDFSRRLGDAMGDRASGSGSDPGGALYLKALLLTLLWVQNFPEQTEKCLQSRAHSQKKIHWAAHVSAVYTRLRLRLLWQFISGTQMN